MDPRLPAKAETKEPEVKILPSEKEPEREEIILDAATGAPVETPAQPAPSVSPDEFRKVQARMEFQARQNEREMREMKELLRNLGNKPAPAEKPKVDDEWGVDLDAIGQADWKKGVSIIADKRAEKIAEDKFNKLMAERDKQQAESQRNFTRAQQFDTSKNWVLSKYPSLNDESSDEFREYVNILNEQPELRDNPLGPKIAMYEMEARMKTKAPAATNTGEEDRLRRIAAGSTPQARPTAKSNTISLTQEELDMCKDKGLSPKLYAQMKTANYKEGVSA